MYIDISYFCLHLQLSLRADLYGRKCGLPITPAHLKRSRKVSLIKLFVQSNMYDLYHTGSHKKTRVLFWGEPAKVLSFKSNKTSQLGS